MQNDIVQQTVDEVLGMLGLQNTSIQDKTQEQNKKLDTVTTSALPKEDAELKPFTLIQCFYGVDEQRISATTTALNYMLCLDPKPDEWIFIEAQKSKDLCKFSWLAEQGVKYKFIKTSEKNDFIPLKSALWNIGAKLAKSSLLAFVDADCYFLDLAWANSAKAALSKYDFCSLAQYNIYEEKSSELLETVGARWPDTKDRQEKTQFGHCGFTFGAKKAAFDAIGKMQTLPTLEDIYMWTKIFGTECFYGMPEFFGYNKNKIKRPLQYFKVGAAAGRCVHVFHRTYSKENYTRLLQTARQLGGKFPGVDTSKELPVWTKAKEAKMMKAALKNIQTKDEKQVEKCVFEQMTLPLAVMEDTTIAAEDSKLDTSIKAIQDIDYELGIQLMLNDSQIKDWQNVLLVEDILKSCPDTKFLLGMVQVTPETAADHLNGGLEPSNAPLVALNSIMLPVEHVEDLALVQAFFGQDKLHAKAVELAVKFMALSNPKPKEWIFVEAQRSKAKAKFKWIEDYGAKYIFVKIENDRQDYFIKEQLWNIGAYNAAASKLVFVDGDVTYCQTDWLARVEQTFNESCELFQPHAWSWRANEDVLDAENANDLMLVESFAHHHASKSKTLYLGHTGYDIAITRKCYDNIKGFCSIKGAGGDYFLWSLLGWKEAFKSWNPFSEIIQRTIQQDHFQHAEIGCANLICFHNCHGKYNQRHMSYISNQLYEFGIANNYKKNMLTELQA